MFLQNNINADSLQVVQDSVKTETSEMMHNLGFNISNIGSGDVVLTLLGYGIVFLALLLLYLFFANLARVISFSARKKSKASGKQTDISDDSIMSGETAAAISMALSLHFQEAHDIENTIITIKNVQSAYSPWNSKLHGLRQYPKY